MILNKLPMCSSEIWFNVLLHPPFPALEFSVCLNTFTLLFIAFYVLYSNVKFINLVEINYPINL